MPSDETRKLLKLFGVAVTNLEDALERNAPPDEIAGLDRDLVDRTQEILALIERLRRRQTG